MPSTGQSLTVGRERPSDVLLGIGSVSGTHATFSVDAAGRLFVTDLGGAGVLHCQVEPGLKPIGFRA